MVDRVKLAKQERDKALAEIDALTQRVADLEAYIRVHDTLHPGGEKTPKKRDAAANNAIADAVAALLSDGGSAKTAVIVEHLKANSIPIPGQDSHAYVSQLLSRDRRFKASRKEGWSLHSAKVVPLLSGGTS